MNPHAAVISIAMNMVPPFDDLNVRRALAHAIDRAGILAAYGDTRLARPTCQVQPPNVPGYRYYCPFHRSLATAKRLVRASGTTGMRVKVWSVNYGPFPAIAREVASALTLLGYRASAEPQSWQTYGRLLSGKGRPMQVFLLGIDFDYPVASDLLKGFACSASHVAVANSLGFCDKAVDAAIAHALRVQATDVQAANPLWAQVDRLVVDRAPWIPFANYNWIEFVSKRVGNYQYHPMYAMLIDQVWLR
jgi:peptide/nickel transport system substrate-binding protein